MSGIHLALLGMTYGGSVTVIQTFTATGEWVCPTGVTEVEWLLVAGGGAGGSTNASGDGAGGGGAGGFRTGTGLTVTAGTTYTITVGAGGQGANSTAIGGSGGDSSIAGAPITENPVGAGTNTLKAYGGGAGGQGGTTSGLAGGSGGGGQGSAASQGGSGVVILKYPASLTATFSAGVTQSTSTSGDFKISTVTATSTTSETVRFSV